MDVIKTLKLIAYETRESKDSKVFVCSYVDGDDVNEIVVGQGLKVATAIALLLSKDKRLEKAVLKITADLKEKMNNNNNINKN